MKLFKIKSKLRYFKLSRRNPTVFVLVFAVIGATFFLISHAATPYASSEAESGTLASSAATGTDVNASGGTYVKFGGGAGGGTKCGLTNAAFCDTFDQPSATLSHSGYLDQTVWGVSRLPGPLNFGQNQYFSSVSSTLNKCGQSMTVSPPSDVQICNGRVVESQDDQHSVTVVAMYPKQPFDIAGRTGKIAFDVSDDSAGSHRAWPEIWYTDKPQPAPFTHFSSLQSVPKNGIGVRFDDACTSDNTSCLGRYADIPTGPYVTAGSADIVTNYVSNDSTGDTPGDLHVQEIDAVRQSTGVGDMNHFELDLSNNEIDVYGTDPFTGPLDLTKTPLRKIAVITNFTMPLTRGLVWMEDAHYNGFKDGNDPGPPTWAQGDHTFSWDNLGFDGPVLPRDLAYDVADNTQTNGSGGVNLGWPAPTTGTPLSLDIPGVSGSGITQATGALMTFNYYSESPVTMSFRLNGGSWHDIPWPFPNTYFTPRTIAFPFPLNEVHSGDNTVEFKSSDAAAVVNVDLILVGAGGVVNP